MFLLMVFLSVTPPLALNVAERVYESGERAERCRHDRPQSDGERVGVHPQPAHERRLTAVPHQLAREVTGRRVDDHERRRLREIVRSIAEDSPQAGRDVAARLLKRSRELTGPPLLGRRLPEFPDDDLRELLERPYRLIYTVSARGIEIVTVMHYRQLLPENLEDLGGGG